MVHHISNSLNGLNDLMIEFSNIKIGTGKTKESLNQGTYVCMAIEKNSRKIKIMMINVQYIPGIFFNLLNIHSSDEKWIHWMYGTKKG